MDVVYVVTGEHESFPGDTTVVVFRYSSEAQRYKAELEHDGYHNGGIRTRRLPQRRYFRE